MTREDDFSVVVFAKNTSGLYRTYRNIKQNPLADTIQILAVRVEGNADQFSQSDLKELAASWRKGENSSGTGDG